MQKLKFAKFQNFQLDNLVDFEKCCKTRLCLKRSVPIQPKASEILPKFCQFDAQARLTERARASVTRPGVGDAPGAVSAAEVALGPLWFFAEDDELMNV